MKVWIVVVLDYEDVVITVGAYSSLELAEAAAKEWPGADITERVLDAPYPR